MRIQWQRLVFLNTIAPESTTDENEYTTRCSEIAHKRPLHHQPVITESYGLEKDSNLHRGDATSSIPCAHIRRLLSSYKKYLFLDITLAVINAIAANTVRHSMQLLPHTGRQSMQLLPDNVTQEMQSLQTMLDTQSVSQSVSQSDSQIHSQSVRQTVN